MTDTHTHEGIVAEESLEVPASGCWSFAADEDTIVRRQVSPPLLGVGLIAASLFANAPAFPFDGPLPSNESIVTPVFQPISRRRISLDQALRISEEIIKRAEDGRKQAAFDEAAKAFDLEQD